MPTHKLTYEEQFKIWSTKADKHLSRIGLVAANWAYFEALIDHKTLEIAGIQHEQGSCLTAQIAGSGRKLDAFISIVRLVGVKTPSAQVLEDFSKRTTGLAEQRNRAIHDPWDLSNPDDPKRIEATARKKLRLKKVHISTDNLAKLAGDIATLKNEFEQLAEQVLISSRGTSPRK
jgi:hypothetical protein